jgi:putative hydrolase of the HAD superfamily
MPQPTALLFDAGHTLVFIDPERTRSAFADEGVAVTSDRFVAAERTAREELTKGVRSGQMGTEPELWHSYFTRLFTESGVPDDRLDAVGARIRMEHGREHLWTGVAEETAPALDALLEAGFRLGVISNADGRMERAIERAGLRDRFEFVIDSEVVGVAKPAPEIFHAASSRMGLAPSECLYVGDLYPVDVVGARGAGMDAVLLDPLGVLDFPVDRIPTVSDLPAYMVARNGGSSSGPA